MRDGKSFAKKGNVAHTKELASAVLLLAAAGSVYALGRFFFKNIYDMFHYSFGNDMVVLVREGNFTEAFRFCGEKAIILLLLLFLVLPVFLRRLLRSCKLVSYRSRMLFLPNFEKLSPIEGFKRVFSLRAVVEAIKSILENGRCRFGYVFPFARRSSSSSLHADFFHRTDHGLPRRRGRETFRWSRCRHAHHSPRGLFLSALGS